MPSPLRSLAVLPIALALLAAACATSVTTPPAASPSPPASPTPVPLPYVVVAAGPVAAYREPGPALAVAGNGAGFQQTWVQRVGQGDPAPGLQKIDFSRQVAVFVLYGQRPTGGYGITTRRAERQGGRVTVVVETRVPTPGSLLPQVITSPWEVIAVERTALPDWDKLHYVLVDGAGSTLAEADP